MNATVRVLASVIATLSAANAFADVRPVPPGHNPGHPGHGPGYPHPGPGPGYPNPGPGYPSPYPGNPYPRDPRGYPNPPAFESFECHDMQNGYDFFTVTPAPYSRGGYVVDINAQSITASGLEAYILSRSYDSIQFRFSSPYGNSHINVGYLNHPYGPTAVLSLGRGYYQEFKCRRMSTSPNRPSPIPPRPYPPSPSYPPAPYPNPHR
jgi:hypothetical protein